MRGMKMWGRRVDDVLKSELDLDPLIVRGLGKERPNDRSIGISIGQYTWQ